MMFKRVWLVGLLCLSVVAISGGKANAGFGGNADGDWAVGCPFFPFCTLDVFVDFRGKMADDQIFRGNYIITNGEVGCVSPTLKSVIPGNASVQDVFLQQVGFARTDEKGKTQVGNTFFVTADEWEAVCDPAKDPEATPAEQDTCDDAGFTLADPVPGSAPLSEFWGLVPKEACNNLWTPTVVFPTAFTLLGEILECDVDANGDVILNTCDVKKGRSSTAAFECSTGVQLESLLVQLQAQVPVSVTYACEEA